MGDGEALSVESVVVGSGPAGSLTACLLAEAGVDTLLLEEGPLLGQDSCIAFSVDELIVKYRSGAQTVALGSPVINYAEGRCVGGGSEINAGLYHRTPAEILQRWREDFQVRELDEGDLLPHFAACEAAVSVHHGPHPPDGAAAALEKGASCLNWKTNHPARLVRYRDADDAKAGLPPARQSMSATLIPRALRAGLRLIADCRVDRLRRERGAWTLQCRRATGRPLQVRTASVFVCAGAIQTPALLRRSGIGRNVGRSLRLHPMAKVIARFRDPVNSPSTGVPGLQVSEFSPWMNFGCSISSQPFLAVGLADHPDLARRLRGEWRTMAVYYVSTIPRGTGVVSVLPGLADPLVRYRLADEDLKDLAGGLRRLCSLLFEAGAVEIVTNVSGLPRLRGLADLDQLPEMLPRDRTVLTSIHLFSSCPMGENGAHCATDSFGRVFGAEGLIVSDASILCSATGVNPQGTLMALARRNVLRHLGQA